MKKYLSNIRTFVILLMAGAAFAACTSDDSIIDEQRANLAGEHVYKLTIKTSKDNVDTRALSLNGDGQLLASWEVDDELAVTNENNDVVGSLECTEFNDGEATFSGTITGTVSEGDVLTLTYHPVTGLSAFGNQDGTLKGNTNSAENYDIATGTVTVQSIDGENITLSDESVVFVNQSAVMKLTMTDGTTTINPTSLKVSATVSTLTEDIFTLTIPEGTYTTNGDGILYFALPNATMVASRLAVAMSQGVETVMALLASAEITFTATVGSDIYTATKTGYIFEGGKYYKSTLTMEKESVDESVDLSTLTGSYVAKDGDVLTGELGENVQIWIDEDATVTLKDVNINGDGTWTSGSYAGITCQGNAEIVLVGENTVKGFNEYYPGINVPYGSTLTINGEGSLNVSSNGRGAGIGGGDGNDCGNIVIQGGTITATGGKQAAGIGGGYMAKCGDIEISGGTITATGGEGAAGIGTGDNGIVDGEDYTNITISGGSVEATGGENAAGIGTGFYGVCGDIEISGGTVEATGGDDAAGIGTGNNGICFSITVTSGVSSVTATKGAYSPNSIGAGSNAQYCGDPIIEDDSKVTQN